MSDVLDVKEVDRIDITFEKHEFRIYSDIDSNSWYVEFDDPEKEVVCIHSPEEGVEFETQEINGRRIEKDEFKAYCEVKAGLWAAQTVADLDT